MNNVSFWGERNEQVLRVVHKRRPEKIELYTVVKQFFIVED